MAKYFLPLFIYAVTSLSLGCVDKSSLAESSFGKVGQKTAKASVASVISMGRDDDDGKAKKWHIGGGIK
jgi:hypothetical protein